MARTRSSAPRLDSTYVHLGPDGRAELVPVGEAFWSSLASGARPELEVGRLVTKFDFEGSWANWEKHPAGEEIAILIAGEVDFVLDEPSGERIVHLSEPGEFILVPRDTWHTAHGRGRCSMVFVTQGAGTEHRES